MSEQLENSQNIELLYTDIQKLFRMRYYWRAERIKILKK